MPGALSRQPFEGRWRVRRMSGLLLPFGITKRIAGAAGMTYLCGLPVGAFHVRDHSFVYRRWPVRDALRPRDDGSWDGEGRIFGIRFCRFRLEPLT